jgi:hypothetical protein
MNRFVRRNADLFLLAGAVVFVLLSLTGTPHVDIKAASPPAEPGGTSIGTRGNHTLLPFLSARAEPAIAYTDEIVTIHVESVVVEANETGISQLVPSNHLVTWTVYDMTHDVVVKRGAVPLFLGEGRFQIPVEPLWTSARLNVSVQDSRDDLQAYAEVRTHMSEDYMLWRQETTIIRSFSEPMRRAIQEVKDTKAYAATMTVALVALSFALLVLMFLKIDHVRSRAVKQFSLADRLRLFIWRWSSVDTFLSEYLTPETTWDPKVAREWEHNRVDAYARGVEKEMAALGAELRFLRDEHPKVYG